MKTTPKKRQSAGVLTMVALWTLLYLAAWMASRAGYDRLAFGLAGGVPLALFLVLMLVAWLNPRDFLQR